MWIPGISTRKNSEKKKRENSPENHDKEDGIGISITMCR